MPELFDPELRRLRRDRAARSGPVTFLHRRALEDIRDRLASTTRSFEKVLLIGALDAEAPELLAPIVEQLDVIDPSPLLALRIGGRYACEESIDTLPGTYDAIIALDTLATVNQLAETILRLRFLLKPDAPLIGAFPGGDLLPALRQSMAAAMRADERATPHIHPRLDPPGLCQLLTSQGFAMPVVDVDRVAIRYPDLAALISDLRGMAATNILTARDRRPLSRQAFREAEKTFSSLADSDGKVRERIEILHFLAWNPGPAQEKL